MYLLRDAHSEDLDRLVELSQSLNTQNLPHDPKALTELIALSCRSFSGEIADPFERTYLFVLEDLSSGQIAGTSQIIAQHGTHRAPHVYLQVYEREHYSAVLDKHFRHQVMRIGYNYEGFTELGGLVVHPAFRGKDKPGKQISFVRFLFVSMHQKLFRPRIIAELLPPLQPDGKSILWEAFGARFTGLSYQEADKLSRSSKEFIQQLFPQGEIYLELLPQKVQKVIGQVGPSTEPVRHMLEAIGFEYDQHIDPFDGGPHFSAAVEDITLVQRHRKGTLSSAELESRAGAESSEGSAEGSREGSEWLVVGVPRLGTGGSGASGRSGGALKPGEHQTSGFAATLSLGRWENGELLLPARTREALKLVPGSEVHSIPFEA